MKRFFACLLFVLSVTVLPPGAKAHGDPFTTTRDYVAQFYPLWFTYYQTSLGTPNRMVGPNKISPIYHYVVAINNDTVYASSFLDLSMEPVIVTIPSTTANYSVLTLDRYCDIVPGIPNNKPGTYALYGPDFNPNDLPLTVKPVPLPFNYMAIIFRADKFTKKGADYVDMTAAAETFRRGLSTMPLCAYLGQSCPAGIPTGGPTRIVPEIEFALPFKTIADSLIALDPIAFLRLLQRAVDSPKTPPMSQPVKALSQRFNFLFARNMAKNRSEFARGARAAHNLIINEYLDHTGDTNWITYDNIGHWGTNPDPGSSTAVQRSEITQFIQYANDHDAAAYFHAFRDGDGLPLNGTDPRGYVLTFPQDKIPATSRFWSLTAYTPEAIELVPNSANKYLVASYTPGLQTNADGSISIYMARRLPADVPPANWLPITPGPFNVMLRDYGPLGSVLDGTYLPPEIERIH
jgi:hypothetical protein